MLPLLALTTTNDKDGHTAYNRFRDYRLSVRPHQAAELADIGDFTREPEWAHGRVSQFWDGVWKRFLVRGPVTLDVKVGRNHSFNTIVQAVTLDLVDETPPPYFGTVDQWEQEQTEGKALWHKELVQSHLLSSIHPFHPAITVAEAADRLFTALDGLQSTNSTWWGVNGRRFYLPLTRWYAAQGARPGVTLSAAQWRRLGTCEYESGLYPQWEDCLQRAGMTPTRDIERALR